MNYGRRIILNGPGTMWGTNGFQKNLNMVDPNLIYTLQGQIDQAVPNPFYHYLNTDTFPGYLGNQEMVPMRQLLRTFRSTGISPRCSFPDSTATTRRCRSAPSAPAREVWPSHSATTKITSTRRTGSTTWHNMRTLHRARRVRFVYRTRNGPGTCGPAIASAPPVPGSCPLVAAGGTYRICIRCWMRLWAAGRPVTSCSGVRVTCSAMFVGTRII